ncbi:hypothetical protein GGD83_000965 [Rhodoblastus sphagnicola]|uniref:hypothetical protein n=1 Tax=Rhodoblastus sphagnicola TaxID=333368 RepID=UPI0011B0BE48|nr:hypothetical protein [Rhodoblastus sphagnicola]MBB4197179.1 hypothetical protein [Rhodoblastus sphagnicola]
MSGKQIRGASDEAEVFKRRVEARESVRQVSDDESGAPDGDKLAAEAREVVVSDADEDPFEVDVIQRRVAARKIAREAERKKKEAEEELQRHLMERALRAKAKPAPVEESSLWSKIYSGFLTLIKSKLFHNAVAYSALAVMVGGLGVYINDLLAKRADASFREHCLENNLKYASGSRRFCYDNGRFAHGITESGVTGRLNLDWSVNDRQLRLAIKAAERSTGPVARPGGLTTDAVAKPIGSAPGAAAEPVHLAPGTVAELAAQIMRN